MKPWLTISLLFITLPYLAFAAAEKATNLQGGYGLFRMKRASEFVPFDYHIVNSVEYTAQTNPFHDTDGSEDMERTQGAVAFGFAPYEFLNTNAYLSFSYSSLKPSAGGGTFSSPIMKSGVSVAATRDASRFIIGLEKELLTMGLNLSVEFSKLTRFFTDPIVNPALILSSDLRPLDLPLRGHLNLEFRMKNEARYFSSSTLKAGLSNFDRFSAHATATHALGTNLGLEVPLKNVVPSAEWECEWLDRSFSDNPNIVTVGAKFTPFSFKNIVFFSAFDIGLNSHHDNDITDAAGGDVPAVPLWNVIAGLTIQSFARKKGHLTIPEDEFASLQKKIELQNNALEKIQRDIKFNRIYGTVKDAETKAPLQEVRIQFPNNSKFAEIATDRDGQFLHYYAGFDRNMLVFSKAGYAETKKFVALKPGEGIELEIELAKATAREEEGIISLTISDSRNKAVSALVTITRLSDREEKGYETSQSGELLKPLKAGQYRIHISAPGYKPETLTIEIAPKEKLIKQVTLTPE